MPDGTATDIVVAERFFKRLPPPVVASLTPVQIRAIARAVRRRGRPPAVNIRLSLPTPFGRFYLAVLADRERRSRQRLREERKANPLRTLGNFLFLVFAAIAFYGAAVAGVMLYLHSWLPGL